MKTVVIIPGFMHDVHGSGYAPVLQAIEQAGYAVIALQPTWERTTIDDWLALAYIQLQSVHTSQAVIIGFSFGAMIAAGLAARMPFKKALLCSLSPYWAEDLPRAKQWWLDMVGKKRTAAFGAYYFKDVVKDYKVAKTTVFSGAIEYARRKAPAMAERARIAAASLPNAKLCIVPGAGHNMAHPRYIAAIVSELS